MADSSARDRAIEAAGWLRSMVSTSSRDWGQASGDALIYGVLVGWDCPPGVCDEAIEDAEHWCERATADLATRHGWTAATVEKMRERHAALRALAGEAGAPDTPPADELDELDISGGPEHRVTKHWDNEGGEVIWRSCSCGHDWTTADVEVCPEAPYADDEHGVAWSTIKSLAARVDRHEVDEHEAADVIVRALRAGAGAS